MAHTVSLRAAFIPGSLRKPVFLPVMEGEMGCVVCLNKNAMLSSLPYRPPPSSGRTQKQVLDYVKEGGHKKVQFER